MTGPCCLIRILWRPGHSSFSMLRKPMNRTTSLTSTLILLLAGLHVGSAATDRTAVGPRTALDRYVQAPDTNYSFRVASTVREAGCTSYMISLTSQAWLTTNEVN